MKLLRYLLPCLCLAFGLLAMPARASDTGASATVEQLHAALLEAMKSGDASISERADALRPVIHDTFDFETIARVVLGRTWVELGEAERERFVEVFAEHSVATYASRFKSHSDESFVTVGVDAGRREDESLVRTRIERPASGKSPVSLQYLLKSGSAGHWRIVNVVADGVSDLSLKRTEYAGSIKEAGFNGLIEHLQAKTADLYSSASLP